MRSKAQLSSKGNPNTAIRRMAAKVLVATIGAAAIGTAADELVPLFLPGSDWSEHGRQGFVRVVNHSDRAGEVAVRAIDDEGAAAPVVTLAIEANSTVHFTSADLEGGNPGKGLTGASGSGTGNWRLELESDLHIEALSFVRTADGFLTAMHDTVPVVNGRHRVATFNPGSNRSQRSLLRLVNLDPESAASVSIAAVDDDGRTPGAGATAEIPAGAARTFSAAELEAGGVEGLAGSIGDGRGKWRLVLETGGSILAMSLLSSPTGHLTNLSTAPRRGAVAFVPLFLPGSDWAEHGRQGFVRVVNHSDRAGEVAVRAVDDEGAAAPVVTLAIGAGSVVHFNSADLEDGNADKGLTGASGSGAGDWRLELESDLDIEALSFVRTRDGFLTAMHDTVPVAGGRHRVATFNPGSNRDQRSLLRLVNLDPESPATVSITGVDDDGRSPGGGATAEIPAGAALTFSAAELEAGGVEGLAGSIGDGRGKWSLDLETGGSILAMSLLSSPTGHLTNLSTTPGRGVAFSPERVITTAADGARSVHAADLDGDGDLDVLSASSWDDKIAWYENEGGGSFSAQRVITTAANFAHSVHAADLDGDGDADVLSASWDDDKIAWYENLGGGSFSAQRVITTEANGALAVHAADLDGDGDADVLSASTGDDKIAWYENEGGGSFSAQRVITTAANFAHSVHAADLDGDGDADVLSASFLDDKIAWYENEGGGSFSAQRVITSVARGALSVHAADLDGDGDADVLSASWDDDKIAWYENEGGGTFSAQRVITTAADGAFSVHAADLDGDGDADVLSASEFDDKIAWYENEGGGAFSAQRVVTAEADAALSVHAADVDGDGDADVLSASARDGKIAWYENQSDHGDDHRDTAGEAMLVTVLPAFLHGVVESAGDRDVFRFATGRGTLRAYSNGPTDTVGTLLDAEGGRLARDNDSGTGTNFDVSTDVEAGVHHVEVRGDAARTGPYTLSIEFVAADVFSLERVITTEADGATAVHAADLDGDGDADVLSASSWDDKIAWYENEGGGSFSAQRVITTDADGASSVHAADLDGDGDADVLSASVDDKIAWYENEGGGSFSSQRVVTTEAYEASSVHAADLDGDGDADVLSASWRDDKIAWYENEGGGAFSAQRVVTTEADSAWSVHAADLDGDGDADVLSASIRDDKIAWYENEGGGSFSAQRVITTAAGNAFSVHAADLDGDGDADVLSASWNDDKIAWYENRSDHGDDHRDTAEEAMLVTALPAFLHGVLESAGDRDVFRFATGRGTLRAYSNGPTDTVGRLLDGTGAVLASNNDGGAGANFRIQTAVAAGVHFVEVRGDGARTGPYTLSIEFVADDSAGQGAVASACGRTPAVRDRIVAASNAGGCGDVTAQALADVATLDLSDSGIATLRKGDFAGMPNLRELSLGGAALSRLPAGLFDGLPALEHLSLSGTGVAALPERVFGDLHGLRTLSLADNALAALPPGAFAGLRDLERLDLSGNRLESLPPDVFAGLWRLAELRLAGNALQVLDATVFSDLDALRLADLRFNRLAALPPGVFAGLRLDALRLEGNPGAPFAVDFAVERADRSDPAAPAPGTVRLRFAPGAILDYLPFDLSVPAGAQRGALSADALTIEAGADAGRSVAAVQAAPATATWVHGGRPQRIAGAFDGLEARIAAPVALFAPTANRMPRTVGRLRGHATTVGVPLALHSADPGCCEVADVAAYFKDDDGDPLSYAATSLDPRVATAVLAGSQLVFEPTAPGRTVVRLTATDAEGTWTAREIDLDVLPAPDPGGFDIDVVFAGDPAAARREAVLEAARRWEQVVVGDLGDVGFSGSPAVLGCGGGPVFGGVLDDIRVHVRDGHRPRAGPRRIRADGGLPLDACVRLAADAQPRQGGPVHEIGHALGFGTLWGGLVQSGTSPSFEGVLAKRAFNAAGRTQGADIHVSADEAHWSPSWAVHRDGWDVVADAMAAPVAKRGGTEPSAVVRYVVSETTVQSMADLGYLVDAGGAEAMLVAGARTTVPEPLAPESVDDARPASDVRTGIVEIVDSDGNTVGRMQSP